LPPGDANFPLRWSLIKRGFSAEVEGPGRRSASQASRREKGIWQRRYWEHQVRHEDDFRRHVEYIHYNPVKHGLVQQVRNWPFSSFHRWVKRGDLTAAWGLVRGAAEGRFGE
jgi:putative transposase